MKTNFGYFKIDVGDDKYVHISPLITGKPEWSGVNPDRRAFMLFVSTTGFGLMRLTEPVLIQDHENVTEKEIEQMLGVYAKYPRETSNYREFLKG